MVAVCSDEAVDKNSREYAQKDPVILFDLRSLAVDTLTFLNDFQESFNHLPWDYYDVRREQLALLGTQLEEHPRRDEVFSSYYLGNLSFEDLLAELPPCPPELLERITEVMPYRRRTTSRFRLERYGDSWQIHRESNIAVQQTVATSDYRSLARVFPETSVQIIEHVEFRKFLQGLGRLVRQLGDPATALSVTSWQTGVVARPGQAGSNSPEGIHQDGSDYIVSALVTARKNIEGGRSRVFREDKTTEVLSVVLEPGQGIFQADAGSPLWHDVTPISIQSGEEELGIRNLFGFDIDVVERE